MIVTRKTVLVMCLASKTRIQLFSVRVVIKGMVRSRAVVYSFWFMFNRLIVAF